MKPVNQHLVNIFAVLLLCLTPAEAGEVLYGKDIKHQAAAFFKKIGIEAEILTSDKRAFFTCSNDLTFHPRIDNDWRTIEVQCESENWQSVLRTTAAMANNTEINNEIDGQTSNVISLTRNVSRGQVLTENDLALIAQPLKSIFEGFDDIDDLLGRKVTRNLAKGTILKPRHVKFRVSVNKNDTVLIVIGNGKVSITTYGIALSSGQTGDMITVENKNSQKTFKAIVLDEKKVTPLANM